MAQKGINKVIIIGHLGQDPEIRHSQNGTCFASMSVATSESWKDKTTGQQQEQTEWHRVSLIGKVAEIAGEYLRKGAKVYLEGKLQTRKWQDQQGNDRYTTEVVVGMGGTMQMLDSRGANDNGGGGAARQAPPQQQAAPAQQFAAQGHTSGFDDDIPF